VPLHPTQLYSAAGNLALFVLLSWMATQPLASGQLAGAYLVVGSAGRFVIELIRGVPAPRRLGLTPFQWVALGTLIAGVALLLFASAGTHTLLFEGSVAAAWADVARLSWAPAWIFVIFVLVFGLHGRRLGAGEEER
jgi:prolipoprotein diacylglyceryltransferase